MQTNFDVGQMETVWAQPGDSDKTQTTFPVRALQKPMSPQLKTSKAQSS